MKTIKICTIALLLFAGLGLSAQKQNITGTWEGFISGERLQINVIQDGTELCGYTYDYQLDYKSDFCKAYFKGIYNTATKSWLLSGTSFIMNSGNHVLMRIKLWRDDGDPKSVLRGNVSIKSDMASFFGLGSSDNTILRKVAGYPAKPGNLPICYEPPAPSKPEPKTPPVTVTPKPPIVTPAPPATIEKKPAPVTSPIAKADTVTKKTLPAPEKVKPAPTVPVSKKVDVSPELEAMAARKKTEMSRIKVSVKHLRLEVYDNGTVDNDTVTIFYNGRIIANRKWLSEKALVLDVDLDSYTSIHEITMYANNLGSIPPNTALIVVTAGDKRYELRSSASLQENAVLVFEYVPE